MASGLRLRLQAQYQEVIEEQPKNKKNYVDDIISEEERAQIKIAETKENEELKQNGVSIDEDGQESNVATETDIQQQKLKTKEEIQYVYRSYTIQSVTKQKLRIHVRTERIATQDYINRCLDDFFSRQDYSRKKASPEEYRQFQIYEEGLGRKEARSVRLTVENAEKLEYWSSFYAVTKSVLMNYILELFLQ